MTGGEAAGGRPAAEGGTGGPWVVVYTAPNLAVGEMIREFLANEGFPAMVRESGLPSYIAVDSVDIVVTAEREAEARQAIEAFLHGAPEGWDREAEEESKNAPPPTPLGGDRSHRGGRPGPADGKEKP